MNKYYKASLILSCFLVSISAILCSINHLYKCNINIPKYISILFLIAGIYTIIGTSKWSIMKEKTSD